MAEPAPGDTTGVGGGRPDVAEEAPPPDRDAPRRTPDPSRSRAGLANTLTLLRALLVPVILWLLVVGTPTARWWALGIFVFAAATDSLDGWVARRWHRVTAWGKLADPIADKLLVGGALISLAAVGELPWWAVVVILAREVGVTVLRLRLVRGRGLVVPASAWGKLKTVSQIVAVVLYLWPGRPPLPAEPALYVAVALTLWSGLDYARSALRRARA